MRKERIYNWQYKGYTYDNELYGKIRNLKSNLKELANQTASVYSLQNFRFYWCTAGIFS